MKILGRVWRNLPLQEKEKYKKRSAIDRARWEKEKKLRDVHNSGCPCTPLSYGGRAPLPQGRQRQGGRAPLPQER